MSPPSKIAALGEAIMAAKEKEAIGDEAALMLIQKACAEASAEERHEVGKYKGMNNLGLSIRAASECTDTEWGYSLVDTVLTHGVKYADSKLEAGKSSLMLAAHIGRHDLCDLLLDAKASPCTKDVEGVTPLHAACMRLDAERANAAHRVVKLLLMRGGKAVVNTPNTHGQTPLLLVVSQSTCSTGVSKVIDLLLRHGASLTLRMAPLWHSPYSFALQQHGRDSELTRLLREKHESDEAIVSAEQAEVIVEYFRLHRDFVAPVLESTKLDASLLEDGNSSDDNSSDGGRAEMSNWLMQQAVHSMQARTDGLVNALCRFAGVDLTALDTAADGACCSLEQIWRAVMAATPRVVATSWESEDELTVDETGEIQMLSGGAHNADPPQALLVQPPDKGVVRFLAGRGIAEAFLRTVQAPLQHALSFAIPNDAALKALSAHAPLCEVGAGTGYWGARLRQRGVQCEMSDLHPPADGRNRFCGAAIAQVEQGGGAETAARFASHALLLVWPYSLVMEGEEGAGEEPWDAEALAAYRGDVVCHVGELAPKFGTRTTSEAFARRLDADFELQETVALPNWPHMHDELTIWRRRVGPLVD